MWLSQTSVLQSKHVVGVGMWLSQKTHGLRTHGLRTHGLRTHGLRTHGLTKCYSSSRNILDDL